MATLPALGTTTPLGPQVGYPYKDAYPHEGQVEVCLYSLPWNETNLPAFTSKTALDDFLDNLEGAARLTISQFKNTPPAFTVPLEIPYDSALSYTYMRVRTAQQAPAAPLPFDKGTGAKKDYYYFVQGISYAAPSTTYFDVNLDVWHTFFDDIDIAGGDLKRGHHVIEHAPSVEEYLANPIANTHHLTAPDFNFGDPEDLFATTHIEEFGGNGTRYLVIFANIPPRHLTLFTKPQEQGMHGPVFDGDTMTEAGIWTRVNYEEVIPIPYAPNGEGTPAPNGIFGYAVDYEDARDILEQVDARGQHLMQRIIACAVLPASLINLGTKISTDFGDFYPLETPDNPLSRLVTRTLNADDWDMPDIIKNYTKAYTYPYSHIVLTLPDGTRKTLQIETLGDKGVSYRERISAAFPWIAAEVFLETYKNSDNVGLALKTLTNHDTETSIPAGDWYATLARWDIPTFTLWRTSYSAYRADNQASILSNKDNTVISYSNTLAAAQTGYTNAEQAAQTGYTNAATAANTSYANTVASTATAVANQGVSNSNNSANTAATNTYNTGRLSEELSKQYRTMQNTDAKSLGDASADINMTTLATQINNEALANSTAVNGLANIVSGMTSGATNGSFAGPAGSAAGAAAGLLGGAASWAAASVQTGITISKNEALAELQNYTTDAHYKIAYRLAGGDDYATKEFQNVYTMTDNTNNLTADYNTETTARNNATAMSIASNNKATTDANAARSRDASIANAGRSKDTSIANAARSRDASIANAGRSKDTSIANAQRSASLAFDINSHAYNASAIASNIPKTQNGGDAARDILAERNVTISHATQSRGALIQLGQMWARYGYSYNGRLGRHLTPATSTANTPENCTFWQIEEITFAKPLQRQWQEKIEELLAKGMTFWKEPLFELGA